MTGNFASDTLPDSNVYCEGNSQGLNKNINTLIKNMNTKYDHEHYQNKARNTLRSNIIHLQLGYARAITACTVS